MKFNFTLYMDKLAIDFGTVGYWNSQEPFRVSLDSTKLLNLIKDAANAYRVYELLLIDRPGDVWDYVSVVVEAVPKCVTESIKYAREKTKPKWSNDYPSSENCIPFEVFNELFHWMGDDTEPPSQAWKSHRDSPAMNAYAQQLLVMVRDVQNRLNWSDHLLQHLVGQVKKGKYPFAYLSRKEAIADSAGIKPNDPSHTDGFYTKLNELLHDPELASIAYRASGDYKVLRMLATEQRERANRTSHELDNALRVCAIVDHTINNVAWDSKICFYSAGLGHGDLFIEGGGLGSESIKKDIEIHRRWRPSRYILSTQEEGEIQGYEKESGDGWLLYKKMNPLNRRTCLELREPNCFGAMGPVLKFSKQGATLFDYDKALIVVGSQVDHSAKDALASALTEWESFGGDPVVIIFGDPRPFEIAGCRKIFTCPDEIVIGGAGSEWLSSLIRLEQRWIDVIIALDVPNWIAQAFSSRFQLTGGPWQPWVVCTPEKSELEASFFIDGNLAEVFREAHRLAKASR